ncbi:hypothetical protein [Breznakiella homolactica]|uniref:Uncharacterized protein n=1 Tax=Breznakiella homolactica TaxID=2798577 RepID=A0A7T7XLJ3_9SPIR|nr:hypothetical protein [Breznakiella homolactica]QQO08530.1 hypothetical protein JFL75_16570 [Breznakiella homolactica]
MEEIFLYFGIVFGARYTLKSKKMFLTMLDHRMKKAGYKEAVYNREYDKKKRPVPEYVVYGSLRQAKAIFVAAYDTPSKSFIPNYRYYPLNDEKNTRGDRRSGLVELALILLSIGLCGLLLWLIGVDLSFTSIKTLFTLLPVLVFGIIIFKITQGLPNSPNFNRNSAALTLMYVLANESADKKNAAFVFCNNSSAFRGGAMQFYRDCSKEYRKKIILLNCLAWGTDLVLARKKDQNEKQVAGIMACQGAGEIIDVSLTDEEAERCVLSVMDESLLLFSGEKEGEEFAVINTRSRKDGRLNTDRLEALRSLFLEYLSRN